MKGILLAGGSGTRLHPITMSISKQLLPVYDKPMIYYPLSVLMLAGIRDILIISTPKALPLFEELLGDGSQLGISFSYAEQSEPRGIAEALLIGKEFIKDQNVCLALGDNIFYGQSFQPLLLQAAKIEIGARIFGYWVSDPERYGIVEFDKSYNVLNIEEKPSDPKTNYAVPGLYFYDRDVSSIAETLKPSERGELEITDLNLEYIKKKRLSIQLLGRGFAWLDTGTHSSLLEAGSFVETIERRQGLKIACIEEVAYRMGYIDKKQVIKLAEISISSGYGKYLIDMVKYEVRGSLRPKTN